MEILNNALKTLSHDGDNEMAVALREVQAVEIGEIKKAHKKLPDLKKTT